MTEYPTWLWYAWRGFSSSRVLKTACRVSFGTSWSLSKIFLQNEGTWQNSSGWSRYTWWPASLITLWSYLYSPHDTGGTMSTHHKRRSVLFPLLHNLIHDFEFMSCKSSLNPIHFSPYGRTASSSSLSFRRWIQQEVRTPFRKISDGQWWLRTIPPIFLIFVCNIRLLEPWGALSCAHLPIIDVLS